MFSASLITLLPVRTIQPTAWYPVQGMFHLCIVGYANLDPIDIAAIHAQPSTVPCTGPRLFFFTVENKSTSWSPPTWTLHVR